MPEPTRKDKIVAMLADDPEDLFLRYGLAMELQKEGGHVESLALLDELMQQEPPYVPAYFMAAQQLAQLSRIHTEIQQSQKNGGISKTWLIGLLILNLATAGLVSFWYLQNQNGNSNGSNKTTTTSTTSATSYEIATKAGNIF